MRGYFGIGIEGVSKARNAGALFRTAHAFGASFVFTLAADYARRRGETADTSKTQAQIPFYAFPDMASMVLPRGCRLVGVELLEDAVELPSFHHPPSAAYVLGRERGSLSPELLERCDHVIRIPTAFCINVSVAGALVMYDRLLARRRFAPRPLMPGGPAEPLPEHRHGGIFSRLDPYRAEPPE